MSWLINDRSRDGWLITASKDPPKSALDEYRAATGIRNAHDFRGDSLTDAIGGVVLTGVNSPLLDQAVEDTLDGSPLASDPPSLTWSHAYQATATNQSFVAPLPESVPIDTRSVMIHLTVRDAVAAAGVCSLAGNRDAGSSEGIELVFDKTTGDVRATIQPQGESPASAEVSESIDDDTWHDIVLIADQAAGVLRLGTDAFESSVVFTPGDLGSASPFAIFRVRNLLNCTAQIMGCRIAFGAQVEGRSAKAIAQAAAELIWWDNQNTRVVSAAK